MNSLIRIFITLLAVSCACLSWGSRADWMNLTGAETALNIAEIYVEDDRVRLALEVYGGDLETFQDLIPDDLLENPAANRPPLSERMEHFSSEVFQFVTERGDALGAELKLVEPRLRKDRFSPFAGMINPMTRQRVAEPPEDKRVLYAEIDYPFVEPPVTLTVVPPLGQQGVAAASVGFIAYHKTVPVIDFRFLSAPATVDLDWDDPWYSRFASPTLKRHHDSAMMSFLYVEPDEIRHEVLARPRDLEEWLDLGVQDDGSISPEQWDGLLEKVGAFMLTRNRVTIDGRAIAPSLTRAVFVSVGLRGIQVIEEPQHLDNSTAIVGVILGYPVDALPEQVTVDWDLFTGQVRRVPATTIDPAGPFPSFAEPGDNIIQWRNVLVDYRAPMVEAVPVGPGYRLSLPIPTLVLLVAAIGAAGMAVRPRLLSRKVWAGVAVAGFLGAGVLSPVGALEMENPFAGPPDREAAAAIVGQLAGNLHTALRQSDQTRLRDALEMSVAERSIIEVLPELRRALIVEIQGGGRARIDGIDDVVVKQIDDLGGGAGFRASVEWSAAARAGHWGHLHRRRIRFDALVDVMPVGGAWKLTGLTVVTSRQES